MVDTRSHPRFRVAKSAEIENGGDKIPCSVRNISITGAALMLEDLAFRVPAHFNLLITEDGLTLPCSIVWRRGFWIGVRFKDLQLDVSVEAKPSMIDLSTTRMICARRVADIDAETLAHYEQQEALLRDENGFLLYLFRTNLIGLAEEKLIRVAAREALVWLNEEPG